MKRIIALIMCMGIIAVAAGGCGGITGASKAATGDEAKSTKAADYPDTFEGLCNYLSALGYINPLAENKNATYIEMDYKLIGASNGSKFNCQLNGAGDVTIELYDFSKPASPDEVYNSVRKDGKFSVLELDEREAYLSDNGKYMMIYTDNKIDWKNPKKDSAEYKNFSELLKVFKEFHKS